MLEAKATAVAAWLHMMSLPLLSRSVITHLLPHSQVRTCQEPSPSITAAGRLLNRVQHLMTPASALVHVQQSVVLVLHTGPVQEQGPMTRPHTILPMTASVVAVFGVRM
jgi:hypothetical protein